MFGLTAACCHAYGRLFSIIFFSPITIPAKSRALQEAHSVFAARPAAGAIAGGIGAARSCERECVKAKLGTMLPAGNWPDNWEDERAHGAPGATLANRRVDAFACI